MSTTWLLTLLGLFILLGIIEYLERRYGALTLWQPAWTKGRIHREYSYRLGRWHSQPLTYYGSVGSHSRSKSDTRLLVLEWEWMRSMKGAEMSDVTLMP